jgi:SET domain-containing protein
MRVLIYARRNIRAGEELSYNYGKEYFDDLIKPKGCLCEHCSGKKRRRRKRARKS